MPDSAADHSDPDSLFASGQEELDRGSLAEAEALLRQSLALYEAREGTELEQARCLYSMATAIYYLGRLG